MIEKFIIGAIGVVATIALLFLLLRVVFLIGGAIGTYRIFSTMKATWRGLKSSNEVTHYQAWEQLEIDGAALLFLGIGLTIFI